MSPFSPAPGGHHRTAPTPFSTSPAPAPSGLGPGPGPRQASFEELGRPLRDVTFVVVDLETTGIRTADSEITELGAVKVRGGQVLAEMATLVRPAAPIPPFISVLTGITNAMVATAPSIDAVLPAFLEFAHGSVLVAHNAPFDLGFLRAACARGRYPVPDWEHLDTVRIARQIVTKDESPDCKLASLARLFRADSEPSHRALADARATVAVLHGLFERLGTLGVTTLEDVHGFTRKVSPAQRRKRHLADGLPTGPGVYVFRDRAGRPLYIGTSRSVRARVRSYFTASEPRARMAEMVAAADRVEAIACAHALEAEVRELRLIAEHKPPYNRRSRHPERAVYLRITDEPFPRLARVRAVRDAGTYLGPFSGTAAADLAAAAIHAAIPLRQCTARLSPRRSVPACALADMGRCGAPCDGRESLQDYARHVEAARRAMTTDPSVIVAAARTRIDSLAAQQRFEDAAVERDRLLAFLHGAQRLQRLSALAGVAEMTAAAPTPEGGWDIAVIRHGRLVAATSTPPRTDPRPWIAATQASAETVRPGPGPTPCASAAETERIHHWLSGPGVRLVSVDGEWASPATGAAREVFRLGRAR
ncbi:MULTISPECIES: DEDD exonuclease domain-containing protein [unclassified Frankia]|uniref:DEDD exonuclease domain-containing protein n=1 Tax=unclassified Frankia TaxID=2632575 RepID=UPI002AD55343|nr:MULTISPECIES: DEDD exonuclease domain-containing protein [unclassified Frankia]